MPRSVEFDRRQFLKLTSAPLLAHDFLPDISPLFAQTNQKEQKERSPEHYMLGQAVTVTPRGRVSIINLASGGFREFGLPLSFSSLRQVKISPDGAKVAIWAENTRGIISISNQLFIADIATPNPNLRKIYEEDPGGTPSAAHWSPDGNWLSLYTELGRGKQTATLIRLSDNQVWKFDNTILNTHSFSPDGNWATAIIDNEITAVDLQHMSLNRIGNTGRFNLFPSTFWSPDSNHVAVGPFDKSDSYIYTSGNWERKSLGRGIRPLAFSPDSKLFVYSVPGNALQLGILGLANEQALGTVKLPDGYKHIKASFLNTKDFQLVASTQEYTFLFKEESLLLLKVDGTSGQITEQKHLGLPASISLDDELVNPNWIAFQREESNQRYTLYFVNLKSLNTTRAPATIASADAHDFQAIIVDDGQLVRTDNNYYLIKEGKRVRLVGKQENVEKYSGQSDTALSTTEPIISTLRGGKTIFLDGQKRNLFVPGLTSVIEHGGAGTELSRIFVEFQTAAHKHGYRGEHHINMSWAGFEINSQSGLFYPKDQDCKDTLTHPEERAALLHDFWLQWFEQHPNDELKIITHSEGAQPVLIVINQLRTTKTKDRNFPVNPARLHFIFTHAPILGVDKPGLENIAKILPWVSEDCKLVGPIPDPGVANQKSVQYLLEIWERRQQRMKEIEEDMAWLHTSGGKAESVGYDRDMVIASRYSSIPDPLLAILLRLGLLSDEPIRTQNLPGVPAEQNHMLSIRPRVGLGHNMAWQPGQGLNLLLKLVGPQLPEAQHV